MMKRSGQSQVMLQILQCLILTGTAFAGDFTEDKIVKSFQVAPGGRLTIDTERGSIEIRAAERHVVDVEIQKKVKGASRDALKDFVVTFEQNDKGVTITAKHKRGQSFWNKVSNRLSVRFTVIVPQKYNVDLKTSGGSISVADLEGEARARTSGGSLHFGEIVGPVWGNTSGGSIELKGCQGNATIKTSGGSLAIGNVDGEVEAETSGGSIHIDRAKGSVTAKTSGGSISVEEVMGQIIATTSGGSISAQISRQPKGDCALETSGGNVTVYLVKDIAVNVDAQTSGGRVSTDLPVAMVVQGEVSKNRLQGTINGGGPLLKLHTSGGNVQLLKR